MGILATIAILALFAFFAALAGVGIWLVLTDDYDLMGD